MRAALMRGVGPPSCLYVGNAPKPALTGNYDVLIKVKYTALNRADTLQRQGKYPPPAGASDILGLEAVGEVSESRSERWKVGDKVMALLDGGGYAEFAAARSSELMRVPSTMSDELAACVPEAWLTAYQLLHFVAKVKATDRILILAGASGVGTAAIQLARHYGLTRVVASSSGSKRALCERMGATETLEKGDKLPGNFDVVLDPVAGPELPERLKSCNMDARYVLYAAMAGIKCELNAAVLLSKRVALLSSTLRSRTPEYKADLCKQVTLNVCPQLGTTLQPVHDSTFSIDAVRERKKGLSSSRLQFRQLVMCATEKNKFPAFILSYLQFYPLMKNMKKKNRFRVFSVAAPRLSRDDMHKTPSLLHYLSRTGA